MDKMAIVKSVVGEFFNEFGTSQPGFVFMWIIVVVGAFAIEILADRVYVVVIQ